MIVGWRVAAHMRPMVLDALEMARASRATRLAPRGARTPAANSRPCAGATPRRTRRFPQSALWAIPTTIAESVNGLYKVRGRNVDASNSLGLGPLAQHPAPPQPPRRHPAGGVPTVPNKPTHWLETNKPSLHKTQCVREPEPALTPSPTPTRGGTLRRPRQISQRIRATDPPHGTTTLVRPPSPPQNRTPEQISLTLRNPDRPPRDTKPHTCNSTPNQHPTPRKTPAT